MSEAVIPALDEAMSGVVGARYRMSDSHFHLFDFLQHTDGIQAFVAAMDQAGVDHAMVCGMPLVKKWSSWDPVEPKYYLDDDSHAYWYSATDVLVAKQLESLPEDHRQRFHPFICGFDSTDRNAVDHIKRMIELHPSFWQGIGEVFTRHDDLTGLTYGEPGRADHVALDRIYDFAAEMDMPVLVHSDITSVWETTSVYLNEVKTALRKHPETKFIWGHAGISRRLVVPNLVHEIHQLLTAHPRLYVDLSWVLYDMYLVLNGKPVEEWVQLVSSFPDRFMIGSDCCGTTVAYVMTMTRYYLILDALKPDIARKVALTNFLDILPAPAVARA